MCPDPNKNQTTHTLILMPSGRRDKIPTGTSVLTAASQMGLSIESICGGKGTCGKCQIIVEQGEFPKHGINSQTDHLSQKSDQEIEILQPAADSSRRLACCANIQGDLLISIPEESQAQKQVIRKGASLRSIEVEPAIRKFYIEVEQAQLGDHQGDWGRVQKALCDQHQISGPLTISLIALKDLQPSLQKGNGGVTVTVWMEREILDVKPGYQEGLYGLAIDIGSTTLAAYLCDLRTGELLASDGAMNPQVSFGEDLMSRISYCTHQKDGLKKLNTILLEAINKLAVKTARQAGIRTRQILDLVLAGNTTMTHILLGISPEQLGGAPFTLAVQEALDLNATDLGIHLHPASKAHILPAEAGHVGGDNVAVLIAEQPYLKEISILTVDVGTNAEIVLSNGKAIYSASSPTGPAFEGGQISSGMRAAPGAIERVRIDPITKQPRFRVIGEELWSNNWITGQNIPLEEQPQHLASGICGSGIIEAVAELFTAGLITAEGQFNPGIETDQMIWNDERRIGAYQLAPANLSSSGKPILITQEDVRNIQLAKAALYAGAKLLMKHANVEHLDQIILAGAFGSYINPEHALILGLIPDCDPSQVIAIGNAAGDGARFALLNLSLREEAREIARQVRYIETAIEPDFQTEFVQAMHLPHKSDKFKNLEGILSKIPSNSTVTRKRRFPRKTK
jgi:uncharacterized 2Fe-2S/4Fe-4S cluster protein (DUF4445 family)